MYDMVPFLIFRHINVLTKLSSIHTHLYGKTVKVNWTITVVVEPGKVFSGGHLSIVWISWRSSLLTGALQCCVEVRHVPSAEREQR